MSFLTYPLLGVALECLFACLYVCINSFASGSFFLYKNLFGTGVVVVVAAVGSGLSMLHQHDIMQEPQYWYGQFA